MKMQKTVTRAWLLGAALAFGAGTMAGCASTDDITQESEKPVKDTWITTKVMGELSAVDGLDNSEIGVETSNGIVTLTGRVHSASQRDEAVAAAMRVDGVVDVDTEYLQIEDGY